MLGHAGFRPQRSLYSTCAIRARVLEIQSCRPSDRTMCGCIVTQRTLANRGRRFTKPEAGWCSDRYFTLRFLKPQHATRLRAIRTGETSETSRADVSLIALAAYLVVCNTREIFFCRSFVRSKRVSREMKGFSGRRRKPGKNCPATGFVRNITFDLTFFFFVHRNVIDCIRKLRVILHDGYSYRVIRALGT